MPPPIFRAIQAANQAAETARNIQSVLGYVPRSSGMSSSTGRTRRRGKRTYPRKRPMPRYSGKQSLKNQVKEIRKSLKSDQATHLRRFRSTGASLVAAGQVSNSVLDGLSSTVIENNVSALRYYDPSTPGTLVTADAATGTYSRQIHIKEFYSSLTVRNNYQTPCTVKIYVMVPKNDTSTDPSSFYAAGITDQVISGAGTSPLLFPSDINLVMDNWSIVTTVSKYLEPGRQAKAFYKAKAFDYDPANYDTHALLYQKKYKAHVFYIRVEGVVAHDSAVADQQASCQAGVDWILDKKMLITYDAGVNLNDISYTDSSDTFTNGGVVSNKPVSDNQAYSVA